MCSLCLRYMYFVIFYLSIDLVILFVAFVVKSIENMLLCTLVQVIVLNTCMQKNKMEQLFLVVGAIIEIVKYIGWNEVQNNHWNDF